MWGPADAAKSMIAQQVAAAANRRCVDARALLLHPADLRGIARNEVSHLPNAGEAGTRPGDISFVPATAGAAAGEIHA